MFINQLFGLPGLLCTISQNSTEERSPVELYGPVGLRKFVRTSLNLSRSVLGFKIVVHELCHDRKPEDIDGIVSALDQCRGTSNLNKGHLCIKNTFFDAPTYIASSLGSKRGQPLYAGQNAQSVIHCIAAYYDVFLHVRLGGVLTTWPRISHTLRNSLVQTSNLTETTIGLCELHK